MIAKEKTKENIIIEEAIEILEKETTPTVENKEKEYIEKLQRLQAEFENFRKRTEKEKIDIIVNGNANLITQLLKIVDSLELSLKNNEDTGIMLIHEELIKILEKQGLKIIDSTKTFDPKYHEAIMQVEGESQGAILEEFQKGYLLNDKLLRASKVKISTAKEKK